MRTFVKATASAFLLACHIGLAPVAQAQTSGHACIVGLGMVNEQIWWTGAGNGKYLMDFRGGAPVLSNTGIGQTASFEGTAVYTTPTGTLLLYTDGNSIFNGQTNVLIGTGVGGNPSATEAALIVPNPAGVPTNDFYVFGNSSNAGTPGPIRYTLVNIAGSSIGAIAPLDGGRLFGESLAVVPAANGTDFWILSVTNASPTVNAYRVSPSGVNNTPVASPVPSLPGGATANRGSVVYHPPTRQLAISFFSQGTGTGYIYTATFDEATGQTSAFALQATGNLGYAVAFSPDASKLYYSVGTEGWSGTLTHKDIATNTITSIAAGTWAMPRLAPDGRVYVVAFGATTMGVVNSPNSAAASIGWNPTGIALPSGASAAYALVNQTYAPCSVNAPPPPAAAAEIPMLGAVPLALLALMLTIAGVAASRRR